MGAGAPAADDSAPGGVVDDGRSVMFIGGWVVPGGCWASDGACASDVDGWAFQVRINRPRTPAYHPSRHSAKCVVPLAARCTPTCWPQPALGASSQNCAVVRETDVTWRQPLLPALAFSVLAYPPGQAWHDTAAPADDVVTAIVGVTARVSA